MATDSEAEETEERQEKCQQVRKWKQELKELQEYHESHNIFLHTVPEWNGGSHMGYLESCILDAGPGFFFIRSFKEWWIELQKQSQGVRHSASSACHRLQTLEQMYDVKLSSQYNVCAEYLVEVFRYPRTRNCISMDAADGYWKHTDDWIVWSHGTVLHCKNHHHAVWGGGEGQEEEVNIHVLLLSLSLHGAKPPFD